MYRLLVWFLLLLPLAGFSQGADFDFDTAVTDQTCPGTGALTFSPSNVPADAVVTYYVYLMPNISVPIRTSTDLSVSNLPAGQYTIIASAVVNGVEDIRSHVATIQDLSPPAPEFTFELQAQNCNNLNQINVVVTSGVATAYEIFSGPVTAPQQSSSLFTGLVDGEYIFRVYDACGQAVSKTFTAQFNAQPPVVSAPTLGDVTTADCSVFTIVNTLSYPPGTIATYPLSVQFTLHASDGSPDIVISQNFTSGDLQGVQITNTFPYTLGVQYTYDVAVVNGCGVPYNSTGNAVNPNPSLALSAVPTPCGVYYINATASGFAPPYAITFTGFPDGFNPSIFNTSYPGPFTTPAISFGGNDMPVPEGLYTAFITDACNRTSAIAAVTIMNTLPTPEVVVRNNGCFSDFGSLGVSIADRSIVQATIVTAPPLYTQALPSDVSSFINSNGNLFITNLPIGGYVLELVDNCGVHYVNVTGYVPAFTPGSLVVKSLPDCEAGFGTVEVASPNGALVSISLIAAPDTYTQSLPYNVTSFVRSANGRLYLDGLPEGSYTFSGTDTCGFSSSVTVNVAVNNMVSGLFAFTPLCNSFNITLADPDTVSSSPSYWLQIENPMAPGTWMNPEDGTIYNDGDIPTSANSVALDNNTTNLNFAYFGVFRIIKYFTTYGSGTNTKNCIKQIGDTFEYQYGVEIDNVYALRCAGHQDDVYVEASGLAPLHYSIVDPTDNRIVILDNGSNPIFANLPLGSYKFKVENRCGQFVYQVVDVANIPDVVNAATPSDITVCVPAGQALNQPVDLTVQNTAILNGSVPSSYSVIYYLSLADAESGTNAISNPSTFVPTSNPQQIFAKMNQVYINRCPDIVSFNVTEANVPVLNVDKQQYLCEDVGQLTLQAGTGFDSYLWQPGMQTTPEIIVTQPGDYAITVTTAGCTTTETITVLPVSPPEIQSIETFDWTEDNNGLTVVMATPEMYEYSLDGINYQDSNTFSGLPAGIYSVFVRDKQACNATGRVVPLLYYPKFFTPNGDGYNEKWRIEFSSLEPKLQVYIYDRFGKLITGFPSQSEGWDGTFNGNPLPSTDYWFVVVRQDGRIHKGHFSLIR